MAGRSRRSARVPTEYKNNLATKTKVSDDVLPYSANMKRGAAASKENPSSLDFLLKNSKSPLVSLQLSSLINENTWSALSQDNRAILLTLLPPAAFGLSPQSSIPSTHPSKRQSTVPENREAPGDNLSAVPSEPNASFFTDVFFEAAAKTFQDHLYSGWLTLSHESMVQQYRERVKTGESHAPWKDEIWNTEHPITDRNILVGDGLAGDASSLALEDLAKHSVLRVDDVLAYRRSFSQFNITVAKDVLIQHIHPHSITVLVAPSTQKYLPSQHLRHPEMSDGDILDDDAELTNEYQLREMTITNPTQLESALLDMDGRVEKARRPNGNAWKCLGVWRWRNEVMPISAYPVDSDEAARGGREYQGTLFYLRGCFYDDSI